MPEDAVFSVKAHSTLAFFPVKKIRVFGRRNRQGKDRPNFKFQKLKTSVISNL